MHKSNVWYDIHYKNLPFYCKSCDLIGHYELDCPTPALRDVEGKLPYGGALRAPDDKKKKLASFGEAASELYGSGSSFNSRGSGRSVSPSRTSRNSTSHDDVGDERSPPPHPKGKNVVSGKIGEEGGGSSVAKEPVMEAKNNPSKRKRKPTSNVESPEARTPNLNMPLEGGNALILACLVNSMVNQFKA